MAFGRSQGRKPRPETSFRSTGAALGKAWNISGEGLRWRRALL